ncbi:hypothetical protein QPM05_09865, partial [Caldibacillus thermoamylovorans]|nr:hypothetical protein [Caldibacillus thermoamylovorans]
TKIQSLPRISENIVISILHKILDLTTRKGLVAKKWGFPPQNGDEKGFRRQKMRFSGSKW